MNRIQKITTAGVLVAVIIVIAILVWPLDAANGSTRDKGHWDQPFDLAMVTFPGYAPFYLAEAKGFFGDLEVRLHRIEDIATIRAGMAKGELEAYLATTDIAIDSRVRPMGVAFWAVDESSGGDGVVVTGNIHDLADLKGKKVAGEMGFPPYFILLYLLNKAGLNISDLDFQDMTTLDAATAFMSKQVDVAAIYEPYLSKAVETRPDSKIVVSSAQTPGLIVDSIFAREDLIDRSELLLKVIAGWRKAVDYINQHPEESFRIMAAAYSLSVSDFQEQAEAVKWLDLEANIDLFGQDGKPGLLYQNFDAIRDTLSSNRAGVYPSKAGEHLTNRYVNQLAMGLP